MFRRLFQLSQTFHQEGVILLGNYGYKQDDSTAF
jgi:hypothetical protein